MSLNDDDFIRYSRHLLMDDIGEVGQEKLTQAKVLIVGLGIAACLIQDSGRYLYNIQCLH